VTGDSVLRFWGRRGVPRLGVADHDLGIVDELIERELVNDAVDDVSVDDSDHWNFTDFAALLE